MSLLEKWWTTTRCHLQQMYRTKKEVLRAWYGRLCRRLQDWQDRTEIFLRRTRYEAVEPKETFIVTVGTVEGPSDRRRAVTFRGQQLAQYVWAEGSARITETLYWIGYDREGHKRYLVHVRTLHRTKGLRTVLALQEMDESGLRGSSRYAVLWRLRPLGLEEALA